MRPRTLHLLKRLAGRDRAIAEMRAARATNRLRTLESHAGTLSDYATALDAVRRRGPMSAQEYLTITAFISAGVSAQIAAEAEQRAEQAARRVALDQAADHKRREGALEDAIDDAKAAIEREQGRRAETPYRRRPRAT